MFHEALNLVYSLTEREIAENLKADFWFSETGGMVGRIW